jgi:S-adenosylmethionine uptake transporter
MLIVRPGGEGFTIYSIYVLAAVALVTIRDLASRRMTGALPSLTVATYAAAAVAVVFGLVSVLQPWRPVTLPVAGLLGGATLCILVAYVLSVSAMRVGALATVAPFRYTSLIVAMLVGMVVFGERPDALTLIGAAVVTGSGLYTLERERRLARRISARAA